MPHEKRQFENGEIYHVTVRRIGNELLFGDEQDHFRGIYCIYEFNNANHVDITHRRRERALFKKSRSQGEGQTFPLLGEFGGKVCPSPIRIEEIDKRDKLGEVLAFCLMPNHIHLLVRQLKDRGISIYMQKFGSGFASHSKEKYGIKKKGHFYQDRFNAAHIENDDQLRTVLVYIFTNPIALIEPGWKERGVADVEKTIKFLEQGYRWSSYWDCLGKKNFSSIIEKEKDFVLGVLGGVSGCKEAVDQWIKYKGELNNLLGKSFTAKAISELE